MRKLLGLHVTDYLQNQDICTACSTGQYVARHFHTAYSSAHSLTRSLSCLRRTLTRRNLEPRGRNFIKGVWGYEGILFVPLGLHLFHLAAWNYMV